MTGTHRLNVLVTGCSTGGNGHALAKEFKRNGCNVIATARDKNKMNDLQAEGITILALDVTSVDSILSCRKELDQLIGGRLDILVNNAGRRNVIPAVDADEDDIRATFETNTIGPMLTCQAFVDLLISSRGLIVNVSSISSTAPYLFGGIYSSSKAALNNYSEVLRMELSPFHVRVMVVLAGTLRTKNPGFASYNLPQGSRYVRVEDVYQKRLAFSQTTATMSSTAYARAVVAQALKGEGWGRFRLGGTPNWYWIGGMAQIARFTSFLPKCLSERLSSNFFGLPDISRRLQQSL